jgi:hypothetical protein
MSVKDDCNSYKNMGGSIMTLKDEEGFERRMRLDRNMVFLLCAGMVGLLMMNNFLGKTDENKRSSKKKE